MSIIGSSYVSSGMWTSAGEIFALFGQTATRRWADLEGTNTQSQQDATIATAVAAATDDAKSRLLGAPCGPILVTPPMLRLQVTRLAAVILYTGKGVKDTSDEGGANRMSWHKKQAETWINKVCAGQIRLAGVTQTTMSPATCDVSSDGLMGAHLQQEWWGLPFGEGLNFQYLIAGQYPFPAFDTWFFDDPGWGVPGIEWPGPIPQFFP